MSNIDKQALREAAEEALPAMQRLLMMPNDELFDEALLNVDGDVDAANAFNLLSGPETMLALLDENIQLQREKDAIEAVALALRDDMQQTREQLAAAERRIAELDQRLIEYAGIATREARRVAWAFAYAITRI
ncbi:ead/Ea22-like family protein [Salmonella enterica subsp. enterica serovar Newport]|nr:ead/Ea22-like family protein [Salmonella enterica subsp. enterica serovar Newport]